jgi:hypothetical protein
LSRKQEMTAVGKEAGKEVDEIVVWCKRCGRRGRSTTTRSNSLNPSASREDNDVL